MKKTLLVLALLAVTGSTAFAHNGHDKDGKKGQKKATCTMKGGMAGGSCCMKKDGKTAAVKPTAKAPATVKL